MRSNVTPFLSCCAMAGSLAILLVACGGGQSDPNPTVDTAKGPLSAQAQANDPPPSEAIMALATTPPMVAPGPCEPSGVAGAQDYQVGPDVGQLGSLEEVDWGALRAGDTVRVFYRDTPYLGKFLIAASGTASAPVRICGVKGPAGQRPIIDGNDALTRPGLDYGDSVNTNFLHQRRSVIVVKTLGSQPWEAYPSHIQIDGLEVRGAKPGNTFTDAQGVVRAYVGFGACIWIERGKHITLADNLIHDCNQGIYSKSTDDGDFTVTEDIRLARNQVYGNGVVGDDKTHNTYLASFGVIYEFNHYGPLRTGARGSALKDRSVGTVVRYNRIEEGARSLDLVEAEDFPRFAMAQAAYRATLVYGNQIIKKGNSGRAIHYGGDHFGSRPWWLWGEPIFRRGTLYFYNNTVHLTGLDSAWVFQVSTTLERALVWNNVFVFDAGIAIKNVRANESVNPAFWTGGGIVYLGKNWITTGWADTDPGHPVTGELLGQANVIDDILPPVDLTTMVPLEGGAAVDAGQTTFGNSMTNVLAAFPVVYQLDPQLQPVPRAVVGDAVDLGAVER